MTTDEFVSKNLGKYVEVTGSANAINQCTDLANAYIRDVLGLPIIPWTNAQDFPNKANSNYTYILNTPSGLPQKGDLMIFKSTDKVGHIAVFLDGNLSKFTSLDQNYPTGSRVSKVNHSYQNVLGWLRAKEIMQSDQIPVDKDVFESLVTKSSKYDELVSKGITLTSLDEAEKKADALKEQTTKLTDQVRDLEGRVAGATTRAKTAEDDRQRLIDQMAQKLGSIADEGRILEQIDRDVSELDAAKKKAKQLDAAYQELANEKKLEIDQLRTELAMLRADNEKQAKRLLTLEDRLENVENDTVVNKSFETLLQDIINFFKGKAK